MIRAGKLTRQITLERLTEAVEESGTVSIAWTPYATVRAELVQQELADFLNGIGEGETDTVAFRIWWREGVTTADRITFDGQHYNVTAIVEIGHRHGLELRAAAQ